MLVIGAAGQVAVFAERSDYQLGKQLEAQEQTPGVQIPVRPAVQYKSQDQRDPFKGITKDDFREKQGSATIVTPEDKPLPALTVQGIIWGAKFPQAIINNKVVKVGDMLQGVKILSIDKNGITVLFDGRQVTLSAPAGGARTPKTPQEGG